MTYVQKNMTRCFSIGWSRTFFSTVPRFRDIFRISKFLRSSAKNIFFINTPFYSKRILLTDSEEQIFQNFRATTRNEIRQAEKAVLKISLDANLGNILDLWKQMIQEKKLPFFHNMASDFPRWMQFSTAIYDENDQILAGHNYFLGEDTVFLQTSASAFRFTSSEHKKQISNANRLLHWLDIKYFKQKGFTYYDFGGYYTGGDDEAKIKINHFKDGFVSKIEPVVCYYDLTSYPYILADWILKMTGRRKTEK